MEGPTSRCQQTQWRTLLRALASLEHFRKVHGARLEPTSVPFILFEEESPRSLLHGTQTVLRYLVAISGGGRANPAAELTERLVRKLRTRDAAITHSGDVGAFLDHVADEAAKIHDAIDVRFFVT